MCKEVVDSNIAEIMKAKNLHSELTFILAGRLHG